MRFGWWGAAALAMVGCAGQADAATYLRYEVFGSGTETDTVGTTTSAPIPRDISLAFDVDVDQRPTSTSTFVFPDTGLVTVTATGTPNSLDVTGDRQSNGGRFDDQFRLSVTFDGVATDGGFARSIPSGTAMGSLALLATGQATVGPFFARSYQATITKITVRPTSGYSGFSFTAVPEPATWAMIITGVGAIGGSARRRRRQIYSV